MNVGSAVIENLNVAPSKFGKKYGLLLDGQWYDFFTKYPLAKGTGVGAQVEYQWEPGVGTYNPKVRKLKVLVASSTPFIEVDDTAPAAAAPQSGPTDREKAIMRQNAVTNANTMLSNNVDTYNVADVIETAEVFVKYYSGELTVEMVKETILATATA